MRVLAVLLLCGASLLAQTREAELRPTPPSAPTFDDLRDRAAFLDRLREQARRRIRELRNFVCTQQVEREIGVDGRDGGRRWRRLEKLTFAIDYSLGVAHARLIAVNGKTDNLEARQKGSMHIGAGTEFHSLSAIFSPGAGSLFFWDHVEQADGRRLCVARYEAPRESSMLLLRTPDGSQKQGHHGLIYADCASGEIVRLQYETDPITLQRLRPGLFGVAREQTVVSSRWEVVFAPVMIDGREDLLPVGAVVVQRRDKELTRSRSQYVDYHKFEGRSRILAPADAPPAGP